MHVVFLFAYIVAIFGHLFAWFLRVILHTTRIHIYVVLHQLFAFPQSVVGLVSMPGMMTGQLLGGSSPIAAAQYQMAILWRKYIIIYYAYRITAYLIL